MAKRSSGNKLSAMTAPRTRERRAFESYEITDAMNTLNRAEQIKRDRPLMRQVEKMATKMTDIAKKR